MRNTVRSAELVELSPTVDAESGLEAAGRVVDACVDDAGVVRARVHAWARVALQETDRTARPRGGGRDREACHAGADDEDVDFFHEAADAAIVAKIETCHKADRGMVQ